MAEHEDIVLVRRGYEAFSNGDMAAMTEIIAENATQYQPGSGRLTGTYTGREAILNFYGQLAGETGGTFRVDVQHVYADGEGHVVACHQATAQRGDRRLDTGASLIFTVANGQAQDIRGCMEDIEAWDRFWSE
jgi:ketosteroid isomerase-like protein